MKGLFIIIDGMPDRNCTEHPEEYFGMYENLRLLKESGSEGFFLTHPQGHPVESLSCISTLLGAAPDDIPKGRAYIESLAEDIPLSRDDLVLRCNIVRTADGILESSCCEELSEEQMASFSGIMNGFCGSIRMHHMSSYKNIIVMEDLGGEFSSLHTYPPHEHIGEPADTLLPHGGKSGELLRAFCEESTRRIRPDGQHSYMLLPWGQAVYSPMPSFYGLHGLSAGIVCGTEIVKGLAKAMDMEISVPPGATADTDTDLSAKADAALGLLRRKDIVILHINGADEASHRLSITQKHEFLQRTDRELIGYIMKNMDDDTSVLVCSDHASNPVTGRHEPGGQPYILYSRKKSSAQPVRTAGGRDAVSMLMAY